MQPPCRICTHLTPPAAFNPRTLESRYKSPVTRRREYYEPRRCDAKVGTNSIYGFNSRFYNVDRPVNKIQELKSSVPNPDRPKCHDDGTEGLLKSPREVEMNDLKDAHCAVVTCLREMEKIKTFLEDENSWWKILKGRTIECCQQKLPHLHGVLDGSSVTLILLEEGTDEAPRRFVTSIPKKQNNIASSKFGTSRRDLTSETKSRIEHMDEYADSDTIPHYSLDVKSALIEVTSSDINNHEPTQRYVKRAVTSEQSIVASEFWTDGIQEDESEQKIPETSHKSKEIRNSTQHEDKEKRIDRSIVPPKEIRYGQTSRMFKDTLKPQEAFSNENIESKKNITNDFESNVDLSTEIPSRNVSSHKSRINTIKDRVKISLHSNKTNNKNFKV
ncbi:PREDICTED: uncharacterized protein LOC105452869 [Wasmannia auropunctata]|uniref:uncharacterized protein LOC105452869 n=1 Tax=Wasmannia auropunctata TaxID=64793 RepID=UPI0005ED5878|nr:PREDICTED: uncharacterized protein LOC105452869 [Wasmannia auropunctata]